MLVSIIMPVYNAAPYLREAIGSVLAQTHTDWELIAVDDGSKDDSWAILQSYTDPRIKIFQRPNGGQCAATNTGLEQASGDYYLFFDADDLMDKQKIERQLASLQGKPGAVGVCRFSCFQNDISECSFPEEPVYFSGSPEDWLFQLWTNDTMMANHGYLIPKDVVEKAGTYYDESLINNIDFEYFTRIILAANEVVYCPEAVCYYRKGVTTSSTYRASRKKQLSCLRSREKAAGYFLQRYSGDRAHYAVSMAISMLTFSYPGIRKEAKEALKRLGMQGFVAFGGPRFNRLSRVVGFENAIRIKELYEKFR